MKSADQIGTHWDDCWKSHPECELERLRVEVVNLKGDLAEARDALERLAYTGEAVSDLLAHSGGIATARGDPSKCTCPQLRGEGSCIHTSLAGRVVTALAILGKEAA